MTAHTDDIANIKIAENVVEIGYIIFFQIDLDTSGIILQMAECGFTHFPDCHDASCKTHGAKILGILIGKAGKNVLGRMRFFKSWRIGIYTTMKEFVKFF